TNRDIGFVLWLARAMQMMEILIVKLGGLGDVLRTTFVTRGLKTKYPSCLITWLTKETALPLLSGNPYIDTVIAWEHRNLLVKKRFEIVYALDDEEEVCEFAANINTAVLHGAHRNKDGQRIYTESVKAWFDMGLLRPEREGGKPAADQLKRQ